MRCDWLLIELLRSPCAELSCHESVKPQQNLMALLTSTLLTLRRNPRILKLPPYLSALLIVVGIVWLLLLPTNDRSRRTYISENALLPGQVHTYFSGSEQNIFNAFRYEVAELADKPQDKVVDRLLEIFKASNLKVATQKYRYQAAGNEYSGENVYAVLHAPRGDATEAIVLVAAWRNMDGDLNTSGVALALTLARYFKRWSLWSKDIIFLITPDSLTGPQAWVQAYYNSHSPADVASLTLKSGALEGAIVIDNPYPLNHKFESIHVIYDGLNGQLPNLDLFNTAVSVASGQHGMGAILQRMWKHDDGYRHRLKTILRGMVNQGLGHATGPHSFFVPFHVDAITVQAHGTGREDDMAFGRVVESLFRSLNNLMEHFHQSFFLYLLMQTDRFVSIGTYLPSAMLIAANFTIMALALWIASGRPPKMKVDSGGQKRKDMAKAGDRTQIETVEKDGKVAIVPSREMAIVERDILPPAAFVVGLHFLGAVPFYVFNNVSETHLSSILYLFAATNFVLPEGLVALLRAVRVPTAQHQLLLKSFSLLLLGMFLATLATVNFSLSFFVGLLSSPLTFLGPLPSSFRNSSSSGGGSGDGGDERPSAGSGTAGGAERWLHTLVLHAVSPPAVFFVCRWLVGAASTDILVQAAFGWQIWGIWTGIVLWCVWWPAWLATAVGIRLGF